MEYKRILKKVLVFVFIEILVIGIIYATIIYFIQKYYFFVPNSSNIAYEELLKDEQYDEVSINTEERKIKRFFKI